MNNLLHRGLSLTVLAPYTVLSGGGVKVGTIFGIAAYDAVLNDSLEVQVEGVVDLAKDASTFVQGDRVYWDDTAKKATSTIGSNLEIGVAELGAATGVATVNVKLFGIPRMLGLKVARALYDFTVDGGASCTPAISDTIPANAVVFGGAVNSTVAVTAAGSATVSIGTVAGSGAASILAATGKASFTLDAVLAALCATAPFKMSAAGKINLTIATGPLTAGQIEIWVFYALGTNA